MRFETVVDLKSELRGIPTSQGLGGGFKKTAGHNLQSPRSLGVFLGVSPGADAEDYRLAVRTTALGPSVTQYLNTLNQITSGEIETQHVGDILATPTVPASLNQWATKVRPLAPGYSVGHVQTTAGTLGAFVEKEGLFFILSNNHVLAQSNQANLGDVIVQPGPFDGGAHPADSVSRLHAFEALNPNGTNFIDAALGTLDVDTNFDATCAGKKLGVPVPAQLLSGAWKVGRTTGITKGRVTGVGMDDVAVKYGNQILYFDNQTEVEGVGGLFSQGGDSGSLVMDDGDNPFGLLFAGSTVTAKTYVNPIETVLQCLKVVLHR